MKIIISKNFYNGDYGPGSIFGLVHIIKITHFSSTLTTKVDIVTGNTFKERTNIEFNSPLILTKETLKILQKLILEIKNLANIKENIHEKFDTKNSYTDIKIDNFSCRILSKEALLKELSNLLNCSFNEMMLDGIKEKLYGHYKFISQPGDLKFMKTPCDGCVFQDKDNDNKCQKYEQKPSEIIENKKAKCESYRTGNEPW